MFQVVKRDGEIAEFDLSKIGGAIAKAFDATQMEYNSDITDLLSLRVTADFQNKITEMCNLSEEKYQAMKENSMSLVKKSYDYREIAKRYLKVIEKAAVCQMRG